MNKRKINPNLCPMCGKHEAVIIHEMTSTIIKGEYVEYEETVYHCTEVKNGDEAYFVPGRVMNQNLLNARNAYKIKMGLKI